MNTMTYKGITVRRRNAQVPTDHGNALTIGLHQTTHRLLFER